MKGRTDGTKTQAQRSSSASKAKSSDAHNNTGVSGQTQAADIQRSGTADAGRADKATGTTVAVRTVSKPHGRGAKLTKSAQERLRQPKVAAQVDKSIGELVDEYSVSKQELAQRNFAAGYDKGYEDGAGDGAQGERERIAIEGKSDRTIMIWRTLFIAAAALVFGVTVGVSL